MKYEEVIASLNDSLLMLSKHRCVTDLKNDVTDFKRYVGILYELCGKSLPIDQTQDVQFTRCFMSPKTFPRYERLIAEIQRRTTAQLTTGMPMFRQKAKQSVTLRNRLTTVRKK